MPWLIPPARYWNTHGLSGVTSPLEHEEPTSGGFLCSGSSLKTFSAGVVRLGGVSRASGAVSSLGMHSAAPRRRAVSPSHPVSVGGAPSSRPKRQRPPRRLYDSRVWTLLASLLNSMRI